MKKRKRRSKSLTPATYLKPATRAIARDNPSGSLHSALDMAGATNILDVTYKI